jgi:hypothetical protein
MANTLKFGNGEWYGKKDTILAYNDENNNYKPLPFDFSRGSSATVVNKDGLIEEVGSGQARIDYKDNTKGALLLEPERRNLVKSSGDISTQSTYWLSNQGGTSVQNATTAPDGSNTASQINTFGQQYGGITQGSISVSNTEYTYSIYLKAKNGTPNIRLIFFDGATFHSSDFTISSEWKRYDYKFTPVSGSFQIYITCPYLETSFYAWGIQVEQGSYATSYIPTSGGTVTRLADVCNNDFSVISTVANTNTVVLKFIPMGFDVDFAELLRFSDGTDEISLEGFSTNNYDMYGSGLTSSGMVDGALSLDAGSINTISFSYSGTSLRFSHNGSTINTTTPTGNLPTITEVSHSVGVLSPIKILDLRVYNDFKTQEELNTLTI